MIWMHCVNSHYGMTLSHTITPNGCVIWLAVNSIVLYNILKFWSFLPPAYTVNTISRPGHHSITMSGIYLIEARFGPIFLSMEETVDTKCHDHATYFFCYDTTYDVSINFGYELPLHEGNVLSVVYNACFSELWQWKLTEGAFNAHAHSSYTMKHYTCLCCHSRKHRKDMFLKKKRFVGPEGICKECVATKPIHIWEQIRDRKVASSLIQPLMIGHNFKNITCLLCGAYPDWDDEYVRSSWNSTFWLLSILPQMERRNYGICDVCYSRECGKKVVNWVNYRNQVFVPKNNYQYR